MFDHLGFAVADYPRSRRFYAAALAPLGLVAESQGEDWTMFGPPDVDLNIQPPRLWIGAQGKPPGHFHVAFSTTTRAQVDAFHARRAPLAGRITAPPA